ncbi:MAG: hypothetical protein KatS3mg028_0516 [Bacteroidia bacterium]|nr:MAG: hypothetical protein KatS3mg028_0516 [Bacteroidia bacterium]
MASKFGLVYCFLVLNLVSQNNDIYVKKGTIRATATIAPSKIFSKDLSPFYLHGNLEYYTENKVSIYGDAYYFLGDMSKDKSVFNFHHSVFFGANYHFLNNNNDFFVGFHPGVSLSEMKYYDNKTSVNPLLSIVTGYNFYVGRFFHFFILTRGVYGACITPVPLNIPDIRISAGLGFNI